MSLSLFFVVVMLLIAVTYLRFLSRKTRCAQNARAYRDLSANPANPDPS